MFVPVFGGFCEKLFVPSVNYPIFNVLAQLYFVAVVTSAGLTKVSVRDYLLGTVGVIPGTIAFVFIGASTAGTMNEGVSFHPQRKNQVQRVYSVTQ